MPSTFDGEVVAVLPGNCAASRVEEITYRLWAERRLEPSEMLEFRRSSHSPYTVKTLLHIHGIRVSDAGFIVGHNPVLIARRAERVRRYGASGIQWEEVAPKHLAAICSSQGVADCALVGKEPHRQIKTWESRGSN